MKTQSYLQVLSVLGLNCIVVNGFVPKSSTNALSFGLTTMSADSISLTRVFSKAIVADKYFQLEELEDKETATTEVFLESDNTVNVGETDGPRSVSSTGTWSLSDKNVMEMILTRTFEGGKKESKFTDMGEFSFEVVRSFTGDLSPVGGLAAFAGSIHSVDDAGVDLEVGYFNMIDTTDERLNKEPE